MLAVALLLTLAVDSITFLMLPPGAEVNPLVLILGPVVAISLRVSAAALLIALARYKPEWQVAIMLPGIIAASIGAGSNISVLLG